LRLFGHSIPGFPKAILIFTATILAGTAICGIDQVVAVHFGWSLLMPWPNTLSAHLLGLLDLISLIAVVLSALGLITTVLTWPIVTLLRRNLNPDQQQQATTSGPRPNDEPED